MGLLWTTFRGGLKFRSYRKIASHLCLLIYLNTKDLWYFRKKRILEMLFISSTYIGRNKRPQMLRDLPQTWIILLQIASSSYFSPQSFIFASSLFKISYVYVNSVTFWIFHNCSQIFKGYKYEKRAHLLFMYGNVVYYLLIHCNLVCWLFNTFNMS